MPKSLIFMHFTFYFTKRLTLVNQVLQSTTYFALKFFFPLWDILQGPNFPVTEPIYNMTKLLWIKFKHFQIIRKYLSSGRKAFVLIKAVSPAKGVASYGKLVSLSLLTWKFHGNCMFFLFSFDFLHHEKPYYFSIFTSQRVGNFFCPYNTYQTIRNHLFFNLPTKLDFFLYSLFSSRNDQTICRWTGYTGPVLQGVVLTYYYSFMLSQKSSCFAAAWDLAPCPHSDAN